MANPAASPTPFRGLILRTFALALGVLPLPRAGHSLGDETFGNDPKPAQPGWPAGAVDVVNLTSRVYSRWVNGNESFFYQGKTAALNEALAKLAAVQADAREVIILPVPGGTKTFQGKPVSCDWELRVPSGIYLEQAKRETGTKVFTRQPTLVIFAGSASIELKALKLPKGLTLLGAEDIIARGLDGLKSKDDVVAGQAAHQLGDLARWIDKIDPLVASLDSPSAYIQACAAGTLGKCGKRATVALPRLKTCLEKAHDNYAAGFRDAIAAIEGAKEEPAPDPALLKAIRTRIETAKKEPPVTPR